MKGLMEYLLELGFVICALAIIIIFMFNDKIFEGWVLLLMLNIYIEQKRSK